MNAEGIRPHYNKMEREGEHALRIPLSHLPLPAVFIVLLLFAFLAFRFVFPLETKGKGGKIVSGNENAVRGAAKSSKKSLAPFFSPRVKKWEPEILAWSKEWNLDANLIATVMQIESCGDPRAQSHSGAAGLFQVMPFHFDAGEDNFDVQTNAKRGLAYLRQAFDTYGGDVRSTLAGYNAGINGASLPESSWTDETLRYTRWGTGIFDDALSGSAHSNTLNAWLDAGGKSLCEQDSQ
jgi:hypothetical protein